MSKKYSIAGLLGLTLLFAGFSLAVFSADYKNRVVKEIDNSKPSYIKRTGPQWEKQGRIIGEVSYMPKAFTIEIFAPGAGMPISVERKPLKILTPDTSLTVYSTGWIDIGTYDITYKSDGYTNQTVPNVKINPYEDCVINLVFGQIEYKR